VGILLSEATGEQVVLREFHVFGRNASRSDTYLPDPHVSLLHASMRWCDNSWQLTDNSRNGTFLDGCLLSKGEWITVQRGQRLQFGMHSANPWRLIDTAAPLACLLPLDANCKQIELTYSNLLPNPEPPELSIYQVSSAQWLMDTATETLILADGDIVKLGAYRYKLQLAAQLDVTLCNTLIGSGNIPLLKFLLSLDEEHTHTHIEYGKKSFDLGEREHHYCLVTLARRRLADARAGLDASAQGWIESAELAKMLGMELQHVNIQIFRARNQMMKQLPANTKMADIVERRRGGIRFGAFPFEIIRGSQLEGSYQP
jgi:hypothetical protein